MKNIILLVVLLGGLMSCSDSFLERNPTDSTTSVVLLNSREGCELALNGIYATAMYSYAQYYVPYFNEARADNINFTQDGAYTFTNIFNYNQGLADNNVAYSIWPMAYQIVDAANLIINNELIGISDQDVRDDYIAQARTMRAMAYLDLLNAFSKPVHLNEGNNLGVPLIVTTNYGDVDAARALIIENYQLIYQDLIFAAENISTAMNPERANLALVNGLLARMYMNLAGPIGSSHTYQLGEGLTITSAAALEKAVDYADKVLDMVQPAGNFAELQNGVSRVLSESILVARAISDEYSVTGTHCAQWDSNNTASKTVRVYSEVADLFEAGDKRLKYFYDYNSWVANFDKYTEAGYNHIQASALDIIKGQFVTLHGHRTFGKFAPSDYFVDDLDALLTNGIGNVTYTNGLGDFNIMRASEIALLKAEACKRLNRHDDALEAFELVNNRYFETPALRATVSLEEIQLEKRLELLGEGLRMRDLLRWGNDFSRPSSTLSTVQEVAFDDYHMQLPIPDAEIKINDNIKQNPGYGK
ncbi:RagB/SusD family nutrient uptake outer membrane protein [Carboxylicivirga taeanensis]|uniref:RagB/SusD family nutrient uptake outer membrane protein n=1 Tax=Carboxylicivirga taeanensis TaxID=1416875 RepID=UPI003F6DF7BF